MQVDRLQLEEFRSYKHLDLSLPSAGCRIVGRNASGKTTLLEAIVVLATTRSPRTQTDKELINWTSGEEFGLSPYMRLVGEVREADEKHSVEIALQVDPQNRALARKTFELDGRSVRAHDVVGAIKVVLFSPEDLTLVVGSASDRRRHLDLLLSQLDRDYLRSLSRYNRLVTQRNGLLKSLARERVGSRSMGATAQLAFWDERLVADGSYLIARRWTALVRLSALLSDRATDLVDGAVLGLHYEPRLALESLDEVDRESSDIAAIASWIASRFERQLHEVRDEEFRRAVTVLGPHRDDISFQIDGRPLALYGSRGQQRLAVVALKLSEAALIEEQAGERPLLLLDDVLSELDEEHQRRLVRRITVPNCQVLVTSTERGSLADPALSYLPLARITEGGVRFD